jgi:hypothetical protein
MFGDIHSETKAGVIPRACDRIFAYMEAQKILTQTLDQEDKIDQNMEVSGMIDLPYHKPLFQITNLTPCHSVVTLLLFQMGPIKIRLTSI